ncbi:MAG: tRNA (N(6)-L-threonylcarbamoyladenosine(37)-C(2))-methylthiotransferase MtaB [Bacteroidales bacterium]|nr:tRNA (N(6)-L-threonylcarbamoyladenosine(37)-C(2))-methylthiotransferase MtaB [Bacteroidales bacterium]
MNKKKVAFQTFGCKLNISESSTISRDFVENGFELVSYKDKADVYVINSCLVTAIAEKKCRAAIRQAHKRNSNAIIAVIGCFSELRSDEISKIPGVNYILGNNEKFNLLNYVLNNEDISVKIEMSGLKNDNKFNPSYSTDGHTRSFFKIQDGCDYFCTYCIIPFARGRSRSDTIENTIKAAEEIGKTDFKEIILTGVNIGDFGKNNNETFFDLIKQLDKVSGIERIRISSIEPELLSDEIIEFIASSEKILPHFHIPLQSGSNTILKAMKRKYNRELFSERIKKIKQLIPDACIAIDVIVGFPDETDEDFSDSYKFIEQSQISYIHVFSYSDRPDTLASKMKNKVSNSIKKQRSKELHLLSEKMKLSFYRQNINKKAKVLFESDCKEDYIFGYTENYIRVKTKIDKSLINKIIQVRLKEIDKDSVFKIEFLDNKIQ